MKIVSINKVKVKVFEEDELIEKLKMKQEDVNLVLEYQRKFPELLQDDIGGFIIDGEKLCNELGVKDNFNTWLSEETRFNSKGQIKSQGKLIKYNCKENIDYINDWDSPNVNFTIEEVRNMSSQQRSRNSIKNKILLTLKCAKKIAMRQNNDMGDLVCDYFMIMEETLRNYESWTMIREPEKEGWNIMRQYIKEWCIRNEYDETLSNFYTREANMINKNLIGKSASEIKSHIGFNDIITRNHLDSETNKAISDLQNINISLLLADLDFDTRSNMIKITCESKYSHLHII